MAESSLSQATPKRKRDDVLNEQRLFSSSLNTYSPSKGVFSFQAPTLKPIDRPYNDAPEDGNSSPRSRVAQKFQELALESGGGVTHKDKADDTVLMEMGPGVGSGVQLGPGTDEASPRPATSSPRFSPELAVFDFDGGSSSNTSSMPADDDMQLDDDDSASRKRVKLPDLSDRRDFGEIGLNGEAKAFNPSTLQSDESLRFTLQSAVDPAILRIVKNGGSGRLQKSYPSINRLSESKSRSRRRTGTPPLTKRKMGTSAEEETFIIDPIRAALTWHEDEITVYDPEDKDDDGTGINGIGFKPTPAMAQARAQKRRQQLADYKRREESEARAKRSQRRRQHLGGAAGLERKHSMVRVRFKDAEPTTVITT